MVNCKEIIIRDDRKDYEDDLHEIVARFKKVKGDLEEATTDRGYKFYILDDLFIRVDDLDCMIVAYHDIEYSYGKIIHIEKSANATDNLNKKLRVMFHRIKYVYSFEKFPKNLRVGPGSFERNNKNFLRDFIEYVKMNKANIKVSSNGSYYIHENTEITFDNSGYSLRIKTSNVNPKFATDVNQLMFEVLMSKLNDLYEN
jgi:hypothetical protein